MPLWVLRVLVEHFVFADHDEIVGLSALVAQIILLGIVRMQRKGIIQHFLLSLVGAGLELAGRLLARGLDRGRWLLDLSCDDVAVVIKDVEELLDDVASEVEIPLFFVLVQMVRLRLHNYHIIVWMRDHLAVSLAAGCFRDGGEIGLLHDVGGSAEDWASLLIAAVEFGIYLTCE